MAISLRAAALSCAAFFVTGCGGGGSQDTIYVSVTFSPTASVSLYSVSVIPPILSGFDGHDQRCDQSSGALPLGMHINNDCSISGRPAQSGSFSFGFTIRADGVNGSVDSQASVLVIGPAVSYPYHSAALPVGKAMSDSAQPSITGWQAPTDGTVLNWSYAVTGGSLPPGLALNPTSGTVSGTPTTAGTYSANIQLTLSTVYGSTTATGNYQVNVGTSSPGAVAPAGIQ